MAKWDRPAPDRPTRFDQIGADDSVGDAGVDAPGVARTGDPPGDSDRRTKLDQNQGNPVGTPGEKKMPRAPAAKKRSNQRGSDGVSARSASSLAEKRCASAIRSTSTAMASIDCWS